MLLILLADLDASPLQLLGFRGTFRTSRCDEWIKDFDVLEQLVSTKSTHQLPPYQPKRLQLARVSILQKRSTIGQAPLDLAMMLLKADHDAIGSQAAPPQSNIC
jgi:hypothetical protein